MTEELIKLLNRVCRNQMEQMRTAEIAVEQQSRLLTAVETIVKDLTDTQDDLRRDLDYVTFQMKELIDEDRKC